MLSGRSSKKPQVTKCRPLTSARKRCLGWVAFPVSQLRQDVCPKCRGQCAILAPGYGQHARKETIYVYLQERGIPGGNETGSSPPYGTAGAGSSRSSRAFSRRERSACRNSSDGRSYSGLLTMRSRGGSETLRRNMSAWSITSFGPKTRWSATAGACCSSPLRPLIGRANRAISRVPDWSMPTRHRNWRKASARSW